MQRLGEQFKTRYAQGSFTHACYKQTAFTPNEITQVECVEKLEVLLPDIVEFYVNLEFVGGIMHISEAGFPHLALEHYPSGNTYRSFIRSKLIEIRQGFGHLVSSIIPVRIGVLAAGNNLLSLAMANLNQLSQRNLNQVILLGGFVSLFWIALLIAQCIETSWLSVSVIFGERDRSGAAVPRRYPSFIDSLFHYIRDQPSDISTMPSHIFHNG